MMVSSKTARKDYAKVDEGNGNGNNDARTVGDEEGGGSSTTTSWEENAVIVTSDPSSFPSPSSYGRGRGAVAFGACGFLVGFLAGALAVATTMGGGGGGGGGAASSHSAIAEGGGGGGASRAPEAGQVAAQNNVMTDSFAVLEEVVHDRSSFTQGLSYGRDSDGNVTIFETTGLNGQSKVIRINPDTFEVEMSVDVDRTYFGEGSAFYTDADGNGRLIEITWQKRTGFIYDAETLEELSRFGYTTTAPGHEGWGITYDPIHQEFIVSDGSSNLYFWDRDTLAEKRAVTVTRFDGSEQKKLNELEYMDGLVCCNIWHSDDIICVDPATGNSTREYDMSSLWPASERGSSENVLNGIALGKDHVLITGKRWDRMFKVVFSDWPTLFASNSEDGGAGGNEGGIHDLVVEGEDAAAVSYNFLLTSKGTETIRVLLRDLLQLPSSQRQDGASALGGGDDASSSGPRRALRHLSELMEGDGQIADSCHPIAHNLGRAAYRYFGSLDAAYDGMVGTEDARLLRLCNAAYLHGVIELRLRDVDDVKDLAATAREIEENVCRSLDNVDRGPWECRHGIGHGIVQRHRLDAERDVIRKGIDSCQETFSPVDCENGLWMDHFATSGNIMAMENRMMAADVVVDGLMSALTSPGEGEEGQGDLSTVRKLFKLPPLPASLRICSLGTSAFDCFIYAATEYLLAHPGDYVGALRYCTDPSAGIESHAVRYCIDGVGSQCAKEHMDDFSVVEEVCRTLDDEADGERCFRQAMDYFVMSSGGSPKEAGLCDDLTVYKSTCEA